MRVLLALLAAPLLFAQAPPFDILITGARVVDGSGGAWFYSDVGIKGDTIAAMFDPDKVADPSQYDKPHQYSVGFRDVIVNGKFVLRNESVTAERPGRVIYGPAHR